VSEKYDYLIVGAGFAGSILAERLAEGSGKTCLVVSAKKNLA
jgi:UDP-galactopyranose mutase